MGFPFPFGLHSINDEGEQKIPWVWSVNGCVSVIASVLAAIFVLGYGFNTVLVIGGSLYTCATMVFILKFDSK
jgi:hypothetical protein